MGSGCVSSRSLLIILLWIQLVTNADSQISEVIALNPSFKMLSSKMNVRDLSLKEFPFVYV